MSGSITDDTGSSGSKLRMGCLAMVIAPILLVGGGYLFAEHQNKAALEAHAAATEAMFESAFGQLEPEPAEVYDLDKTIRVIHSLDLALREAESLPDYLERLGNQDFRGVDPDVMKARKQMLDVMMDLHKTQVRAEDQAEMWDATSQALALFSVVGGDIEVGGDGEMYGGLLPSGSMGADGSVKVDQEQAKKLLDQVMDAKVEEARLHQELIRRRTSISNTMLKYSETWYDTVEEWDRLCVLRDRAYLATWNGDFAEAEAAADQAIAMAPLEREAHLLKAMAIIEGADHAERAHEVDELLNGYIDRNPGASAPAMLLLGVHHAQLGDHKAATLSFQQASTAYPRQSEALADMLDPYEMRSWLKKSKEGGFILQLYKSTMMGAGYFSPDLQLARLHFDRGEVEEGRKKVMDHFARRRAQKQWDFILSDIESCMALLGEDYRSIFPENAWLDLEVNPTLLGDKLDLKVNNRSDRTLHNATLVLSLQYTDMHPEDYTTLVGGQTVPAVNAHDTTSFGTTKVDYTLFGDAKGVDDIVLNRAILVSNEAVVWVDTDEYKLAESRESRRSRREQGAALANETLNTLQSQTRQRAAIEVEEGLLSDAVNIRLPKELSLLAPIFRLEQAGKELIPKLNQISGDDIELRFEGVNLDDEQAMELHVSGGIADLVLTFVPGEGLNYKLTAVAGE